MSNKRILRSPETYKKIGVGKTKFFEDYRYTPGGEEFVPGTTIRRLKPVQLGERAIGFFEDEADELLENLRRFRDGAAS